MRDRRPELEAIRARLWAVLTSGGLESVQDTAGQAAMERFWGELTASTDDLPARYALGLLYWYRYLIEESGEGESLDSAMALFGPICVTFPDAVPEAVRQGLEVTDPAQRRRAVEDAVIYGSDRETREGRLRLLRRRAATTPADDAKLPTYLNNLGAVLMTEYAASQDEAILDEAIVAHRRAATMLPVENPAQTGAMLANLGRTIHSRYQRNGDLADLTEALDIDRRALSVFLADDPLRRVLLSQLAKALQDHYEHTGNRSSLDEAIRVGRALVATAQAGDAERAGYWATLGVALRSSYEDTGDLSVLDQAVLAHRRALAMLPEGDSSLPAVLTNLGDVLFSRYDHTGEIVALDEAVRCIRRAVSVTPSSHSRRASYLGNLSIVLRKSHQHDGNPAALHEADRAEREAHALMADGRAPQATELTRLASFWHAEFEKTQDPAILDTAIDYFRQAVAGTPEGHVELSVRLSNLAVALYDRYDRTGDLTSLKESVRCHRRAVTATPEGHRAAAETLSNCGGALRREHERTGDLVILDEAIGMLRRAVAVTGIRSPDRFRYMFNLGHALLTRYYQTGELGALDEAIGLQREAIGLMPEAHPDLPVVLTGLGSALQARYERTGDRLALDEAVRCHRRAVVTTLDGHANLGGRLNNLGNALEDHFHRTGDRRALDEAVEVKRRAVDATPDDHPWYGRHLGTLANVLMTSYEHAGDKALREEAIAISRKAVATSYESTTEKARRLSNLSIALRRWYEDTNDNDVLAEAISLNRQAKDLFPEKHPDRAVVLGNLGAVLGLEYQRTGDARALAEATDAFQSAALSQAAPTDVRIRTAGAWGQLAMTAERIDQADEAFGMATELLPRLAARHLERTDAEHWLSRFPGLANDAAACAIQLGNPARAVTLLELGRGVLLAQALETRGDLGDLRDRDPELADRFQSLCIELEGQPGTSMLRVDTRVDRTPHTTDRRHTLAAELESLIARIRHLPGLQRFLLPPTLDELVAQSVHGPIAMINASRYRCDALLLTTEGVQVVPLRSLNLDTIHRRTVIFLDALNALQESHRTILQRSEAEESIREILAWLWEAIAEPILDALGLDRTPGDDESWRRIWWIPTGLVGLLPLHAAGIHDANHQSPPPTVIDRVVSSYAPTIRALAHARRRRSAARRSPRTLIVAVPHTPGAADLPGAQNEADLLGPLLPDAHLLNGASATRDRVLAELRISTWAHFACHGRTDPVNPSNSALLMFDHLDHPLTVLDVSRLRIIEIIEAELAYLSACGTARNSPALTDEAVHITAAFLVAGYPHVVGTLWNILDDNACQFAHQVYIELTRGVPDAERAAFAVHRVTRSSRARHLRAPSLWASHVHLGA